MDDVGLCDMITFAFLVAFSIFGNRVKSLCAASLFVWGCSFPVTVYCYVVYIYNGEQVWNHWYVAFIEIFALSQVGWLSAILMVFGYLASDIFFRVAGIWISVVSVVCHGSFLVAGLLWDWFNV